MEKDNPKDHIHCHNFITWNRAHVLHSNLKKWMKEDLIWVLNPKEKLWVLV